ncbi:Fic/DOC family protein [Gordonia sp. (in: high G+C Gram-positive bacteria)]|uniref:Fic/DOC family protein n=1 Tax=Gordonia sp. (in: high G+C Gram-positive bacteria) TaxID=84139 RepID=UPI0039E31C90
MTGTAAMERAIAVTAWAVAAQRLEGWNPEQEEIAALAMLATDRIDFREYLGRCRRRFVDTETWHPPVLARRRPYLIRGSDVLANNLGLHTAPTLARAEHAISAGRTVGLLRRPPQTWTVPDLHRALFADVYPWAGEPRVTEVAKPGVRFATVPEIEAGLTRTHRDVDEALTCAEGYGTTALAHRLARIYVDYNLVHPFREGNGRTGTLLMQLIALRGGRWLSLDAVGRREWVDASRASINGTTVAGPDAEPVRLLVEAGLRDAASGTFGFEMPDRPAVCDIRHMIGE